MPWSDERIKNLVFDLCRVLNLAGMKLGEMEVEREDQLMRERAAELAEAEQEGSKEATQ